MAELGDAFRALGTGFATAASDREDEMRKLLREQSRQQLLTAALTPVAGALGKTVTDFISEPFKQSASDFYSRSKQGPGAGVVASMSAIDTAKTNWSSTDKEVRKGGGVNYYKTATDSVSLPELQRMGRKRFGENYESNAGYQTLLENYYVARDEKAKQDYAEHTATGSFLVKTATQDERKAALARFNPVSQNIGQATGRWLKRFLKRESYDTYSQRQLTSLKNELNLTDADMLKLQELNTAGEEYGLNSPVISALFDTKDETVVQALDQHQKKLILRTDILNKGGAEQALYENAVFANKDRPLSVDQWKQVKQNALSFSVTKEDKSDFVAQMLVRETTPEAVREFAKNDLDNKQVKQIYAAAYDMAEQKVQSDYLSGKYTTQGSKKDAFDYKNRVAAFAESIINNEIELVTEENPDSIFGSSLKEKLAIVQQKATVIEQNKSKDPNTLAAKRTVLNIGTDDSAANRDIMDELIRVGQDILINPDLTRRQKIEEYDSAIAAMKQQILKTNSQYSSVIFDPSNERYNAIYDEINRRPNRDEGLREGYSDVAAYFSRENREKIREEKEQAREEMILRGGSERQKQEVIREREIRQESLFSRPSTFDDDDVVEQTPTGVEAKQPEEVEQVAAAVSKIFNDGKAATNMLKEIAIVESNMGNTSGSYDISVDSKGNRGSLGVAQIDEIAFDEVQRRLKGGKGVPAFTQKYIDPIKKATGVDVRDVSYEDLADDELNLIFARLYLLTKKDPIPPTVEGRAKYWKQNYNTIAGKGTPDKYLERLREYGVDI